MVYEIVNNIIYNLLRVILCSERQYEVGPSRIVSSDWYD